MIYGMTSAHIHTSNNPDFSSLSESVTSRVRKRFRTSIDGYPGALSREYLHAIYLSSRSRGIYPPGGSVSPGRFPWKAGMWFSCLI